MTNPWTTMTIFVTPFEDLSPHAFEAGLDELSQHLDRVLYSCGIPGSETLIVKQVGNALARTGIHQVPGCGTYFDKTTNGLRGSLLHRIIGAGQIAAEATWNARAIAIGYFGRFESFSQERMVQGFRQDDAFHIEARSYLEAVDGTARAIQQPLDHLTFTERDYWDKQLAFVRFQNRYMHYIYPNQQILDRLMTHATGRRSSRREDELEMGA